MKTTYRERLARVSYNQAYPRGDWRNISKPWRAYWLGIVDSILLEMEAIAEEEDKEAQKY